MNPGLTDLEIMSLPFKLDAIIVDHDVRRSIPIPLLTFPDFTVMSNQIPSFTLEDRTCLYLLTSGSTGPPKGINLTFLYFFEYIF